MQGFRLRRFIACFSLTDLSLKALECHTHTHTLIVALQCFTPLCLPSQGSVPAAIQYDAAAPFSRAEMVCCLYGVSVIRLFRGSCEGLGGTMRGHGLIYKAFYPLWHSPFCIPYNWPWSVHFLEHVDIAHHRILPDCFNSSRHWFGKALTTSLRDFGLRWDEMVSSATCQKETRPGDSRCHFWTLLIRAW